MPKQLLYVSGKYRDPRGTVFVEKNIRAAEEVAQCLWAWGYAVICPHANTRHFDGVCSSDDFIAGDLVMVERCDGVVMLPGWSQSEGATKELRHAMRCGVPVVLWGIDHTPEDVAAELVQQSVLVSFLPITKGAA